MELTALVEESFHRNFRKDERETYIHRQTTEILYQMINDGQNLDPYFFIFKMEELNGRIVGNRFHIKN